MDVRLPDGSGVEACRDILASHPTTRVIFLTSYADDEFVLAAVRAGAHGYVLKNIDSRLLIRSIRAVSNGRSILNPALTQWALNGAKARPAQPARCENNPLPLRKNASWRWWRKVSPTRKFRPRCDSAIRRSRTISPTCSKNCIFHDAHKPPPSSSSVRPDGTPRATDREA